MIGFPLQLPIEATTPRRICVIGFSQMLAQREKPILVERQMELRITVTEQEATALREWMAAQPRIVTAFETVPA